jgi:hypothetical protein
MNSKNTFPEVLWAGTEHSLALAMEAHDRMMAGAFSDDDEEDDDEVPFNYSVQGDVGIIAIKGSLTNRDAWYNRYPRRHQLCRRSPRPAVRSQPG